VAIEQGSGYRADNHSGNDAGERDGAGELRRVVALQREQDGNDADHRLGDARDLHRHEDAAE
jgi:hypothetical protein